MRQATTTPLITRNPKRLRAALLRGISVVSFVAVSAPPTQAFTPNVDYTVEHFIHCLDLMFHNPPQHKIECSPSQVVPHKERYDVGTEAPPPPTGQTGPSGATGPTGPGLSGGTGPIGDTGPSDSAPPSVPPDTTPPDTGPTGSEEPSDDDDQGSGPSGPFEDDDDTQEPPR